MTDNGNTEKDTKNSQIVLTSDVPPEELPLLPVLDRPVFPGMIIPLIFPNTLQPDTIEFIINKKNGYAGVLLLTKEFAETHPDKNPFSGAIQASDLRRIGCVGKLLKAVSSPANDFQLLINFQNRFSLEGLISNKPVIIGQVRYIDAREPEESDISMYVAALVSKIKELIKHNSIFSEEMKLFISRYGSNNPEKLTDMVASMLTTVTAEEMQEVLETLPLQERISKVLHFMHKEVEVSKVKEKINKQIEEKVSKQQRDFFLNEQLKNIKEELGIQKDEKSADIEKIAAKTAELKLSDEAKKITDEEIGKLKIYDVRSSEYGVVRNYVQWIISLPWGITTMDNLDLQNVYKVLNNDHYGINEVKDRIVEFVAVQKLKKKIGGSIICLVGPPGVGKTSLGKSIAHALKRKFFSFSLGGMRDEAEIKGHRRTYIGAMPGKIIQALKTCGSSNPVIMMDEIDKMHASYQGDPASALLEVLDPEQNSNFLDHYLDIRFDLSQILFICTANQLESIPPPLLDRMEIIRLSGYVLEEKREIAKRFVIPKQITESGLEKKDIEIPSNTIDFIIKHYARESGVRTLENEIKKILRKTAKEKAGADKGFDKQTIIPETVKKHLGNEKFKEDSPYDSVVPGIVTGLAWTAMGGTTLYVESIVIRTAKDKGGITVTGHLGDVMKESASIAHSYIASIVSDNGIASDFFSDSVIHLHFPAGATPKDGPSAGLAMGVSLFSLALKKTVPIDIAMTGELTVSGYILPVGGIREKLIAAKRAGKKRVIFPDENKRDFDELPGYLIKGIQAVFVRRFEEAVSCIWKSRKKQ